MSKPHTRAKKRASDQRRLEHREAKAQRKVERREAKRIAKLATQPELPQ